LATVERRLSWDSEANKRTNELMKELNGQFVMVGSAVVRQKRGGDQIRRSKCVGDERLKRWRRMKSKQLNGIRLNCTSIEKGEEKEISLGSNLLPSKRTILVTWTGSGY
jgi:hypothetical protein